MQIESVDIFKRIWSFAKEAPERIIVIDKGQTWTWEMLLSRARAYAEALNRYDSDSAKNSRIPLLAGRNGDTIAAILGILLSGRAVAPVSAQQPKDRLQRCLNIMGAKIAISTLENSGGARLENFPVPILKLEHDKVGVDFSRPPEDPPENQLLYILFTSGSTGLPKGVVADYGNLINTMRWSADMLNWREDDIMGCVTNFFFDIAMFDVLTTLYFGVPIAILSNPSDALLSVEQLAQYRVTSIFSTPAFFSNIIRSDLLSFERFPSLRRIISGGDFFPPAHILKWQNAFDQLELYNVWGPTETSIVNTMHLVNESDVSGLQEGKYPPVGRAHPRMPFVLIDESSQVVKKPYERGEICMLGQCVTRGYFKDEELTRKFFFDMGGQPACRTQDIGYVDEDGDLYILGRIGSTVKVSGYRIDLSEVEAAAARLEEVHLAGAFVVEVEPDIKELRLGIELRQKAEKADIFTIKQSLRKLLPHYMVPKRILVYDELPKSANRKINRKALAEQGQETSSLATTGKI